jgi:hypothetical protein
MKRSLIPLVLLAAGLTAACSSQPVPPSVQVEGAKKSDLAALVGRWTGDYSSKDTGRTGSIVFEFKSGTQGAGDVLMWPKGSKEPIKPAHGNDLSEEQVRAMPQVLNISFVSSQGGILTGTMDPYIDPDCQCEVRTTFAGTIDGDVITGEFTIERWDQTGKRAKGVWKVKREKA